MAAGKCINDPTGQEVLDHRAVAVQEQDGFTLTLFEVMQSDAVDLQEPTNGRVFAFGSPRRHKHKNGKPAHEQSHNKESKL